MEKALKKIADIISDRAYGLADDSDGDFLRGYLFALKEIGEINGNEVRMLLRFYNNLIKDKDFVAK